MSQHKVRPQPLQITSPSRMQRTMSLTKQSRSTSFMNGFGRIQSITQSERKNAILEMAIQNIEAEIGRLQQSHKEQRKDKLAKLRTRDDSKADDQEEGRKFFEKKVNLRDPEEIRQQIKLIERNKITLTNKKNHTIEKCNDVKRAIDQLRKDKLAYDEVNNKVETQLENVAVKLRNSQIKSMEMGGFLNQNYSHFHKQKKFHLHDQRSQLKELRNIFLSIRRENLLDRKSQLEKASTTRGRTASEMPESPKSPKRRGRGRSVLTTYSLQELKDIVGRYQEEYNHILSNMKSQDLSQAAQIFVQNEADNYVMYAYVNGLIQEVRDLQEEYDHKLKELDSFKKHHEIHPAKVAENVRLQQELAQINEGTALLTDRMGKDQKIYKDIKLALPIVFDRLGLDFKSFCDKQLDNEVTETNIVEFFEEVQDKANKLFSGELENSQVSFQQKERHQNTLASQQDFNSALDKLGEEFEMSKGLMFKKEVEVRGQERFLEREELLKELTEMKQSGSNKKKGRK